MVPVDSVKFAPDVVILSLDIVILEFPMVRTVAPKPITLSIAETAAPTVIPVVLIPVIKLVCTPTNPVVVPVDTNTVL